MRSSIRVGIKFPTNEIGADRGVIREWTLAAGAAGFTHVVVIDVLCGGRLRLCLGVEWNPVEYEALGIDFRTRGQRIEEQMQSMRALWTRETVQSEGKFDCVVGAGLLPNAVQKPIPLWLGGWNERMLDRIGRLADGWYYGHDLPPDMADHLVIIAWAAERAGRDPGEIKLEGDRNAARP